MYNSCPEDNLKEKVVKMWLNLFYLFRENFPAEQQFSALSKYIVDQTQSASLKVSSQGFLYTHVLMFDHFQFILISSLSFNCNSFSPNLH